MKLNLFATTSLIAAGVMMAGTADAQLARESNMSQARDLIAAEVAARGDQQIQAVGDLDTGYNPIEPCRLADTRFAVDGPLAAEVIRNFVIDSTDLSDQGGDEAGCDIPEGASSLSLNVTVVRPEGDGFLTVFPGGTALPATATVNYTDDSIVGNGTLIAAGDGLDVYSFQGTDVVVDVTGYFFDLAGGELDCITSENDPVLVEAGEIFVDFAFCDAGYAAVGGGCDQNAEMPLIGAITIADTFNAQICTWDNTNGPDAGSFTDTTCCRIQ